MAHSAAAPCTCNCGGDRRRGNADRPAARPVAAHMTVAEAQRNLAKARRRRDGTITGHHRALVAAVHAQLRAEIVVHRTRDGRH